jgi:hypothetical protein
MEPITWVIAFICGTIAAAIAGSKGRNIIGWFFVGFLTSLIGVIIAAVMSNLNEERRHRNHAASERRRLQEQLRQEKMKNESFRQHSAARLDLHDRVLGVDSRAQAGLAGGAQTPLLEAAPIPPPRPDETPWFYESGGTTQGPVSRSTLLQLARQGTIASSTLVWAQGMEWTAFSAVPELRSSALS